MGSTPALDVVNMFVAYTNSFIKSAKYFASFAPAGTSDVHLTVQYDYKAGTFIMYGDVFPDKEKKYQLDNHHPQYNDFLKHYVEKFVTG